MSSNLDMFSLYDNSPDSLFAICMDFIVHNLNTVTNVDYVTSWLKLKDDIILPGEICEKFLQTYQTYNRMNNSIANIFRNRLQTRLKHVKLRNSRITDKGLRCFMKHKPFELELVQCKYLSQASLDIIKSNSKNLISLKLGPLTYALPRNVDMFKQRGYMIHTPNLQRLTILRRGLTIFPLQLIKPLTHLTYLDLSECMSAGYVSLLREVKNLKTLILHSVFLSTTMTEWIASLHSLQHLDISQSSERQGIFFAPNEVLTKLITNLPLLERLDISGTNLAGSVTAEVWTGGGFNDMETQVRCDIPGLVSRVDKPLEFLGLYGTHFDACKRHYIPAKMISGDANEEQILTAAAAYMGRPVMLTRILNNLYYLIRFESIAYVSRVLSLVLDAMAQHVSDKHIQIYGSVVLFYIVKGKEKPRIGIRLKKRIITALLDCMEAHLRNDEVMLNGCLILCQFKIPSDLLFEYERVVQILVGGVADVNQVGHVLHIATYLLNSIAFQVDRNQKRFLGNIGAIGKMINLISDRLERRLFDGVMEMAWLTMRNVTDEAPENCLGFLANRGMEYFLLCLKCFPDKDMLLRNMTGVLGNIAKVPMLRPILMNKPFLALFYGLLNSSSGGIEVRYNMASMLAHMASDGPDAWTVIEPTRDAVLQRVTDAVSSWSVRTKRNINYRTLKPLLAMLHVNTMPLCQHLAVWTLANLTMVNPDKYCNLVRCEGGIVLLIELIKHPTPNKLIKALAYVVLLNGKNYAQSLRRNN